MKRARTLLDACRPAELRKRAARLPLPVSRPARLLLFGATVLVVATITVARLPQEPTRAATPAKSPASSSSTVTGTQGGNAPNVTPSSAAGGDPFGNEGAVAAASDEAAPAGSLNGGKFQMPLVAWTKVTDRYGAPRGGGLVHGGIDLALDHHTPVMAACTGTVEFTGYSGTYGNHVIVDCGDGFETLYGHLSQVLVAVGQPVDNTAQIGLSGSTGFSTGEHLHFEIRLNGAPVNPENYLDFHIAPGTPLSDGPIYFPGSGSGSGDATPPPSATDDVPDPTATATSTPTPIPPTPTATPTNTPTPTPTPKSVKKQPTPPPVSQH